MIEERLKFEYLDFHLSRVIGKDGKNIEESIIEPYVPVLLKS